MNSDYSFITLKINTHYHNRFVLLLQQPSLFEISIFGSQNLINFDQVRSYAWGREELYIIM